FGGISRPSLPSPSSRRRRAPTRWCSTRSRPTAIRALLQTTDDRSAVRVVEGGVVDAQAAPARVTAGVDRGKTGSIRIGTEDPVGCSAEPVPVHDGGVRLDLHRVLVAAAAVGA